MFFLFEVFFVYQHALPNIAGFPYTYISRSIVAIQLRCGGIYDNHLIANCPLNLAAKNCENPLTFGEDMDNKKVPRFFWPILYMTD